MTEKAHYATVHRIYFEEIRAAESLDLDRRPNGALSWKMGPSGPVGPNGYRLPANVWCAVGLYRDLEAAAAAIATRKEALPFLDEAAESWHGLLQPVMHRGECNHLDRERPGMILEASATDPGGVLLAMTTAGFRLGPNFRVERVIEFRRNVDLANEWMSQAEGCRASQVFTPHTVGDDGVTLSLWSSDAAMLNAAYRPGGHRLQLDRHQSEPMMDRSSFTRFRILSSLGEWNGQDPAAG